MKELLISEIEHLLDLTDEQNRFILDESPDRIISSGDFFARADSLRKVSERLRRILKEVKEEGHRSE